MLELFDHAENIDEEVNILTQRIMSIYESSRAKALGGLASNEETKEESKQEIKEFASSKNDAFDSFNKIPWSQFKLEMITKGIELVERIEKRVSSSVYK